MSLLEKIDKPQDLHELSDDVRSWNLEADTDGQLHPVGAVHEEGEPVGLGAAASDSSGEGSA